MSRVRGLELRVARYTVTYLLLTSHTYSQTTANLLLNLACNVHLLPSARLQSKAA